MTKTTADLQTFDDETHYQVWQSELLAEMGISRWVSQSAPVTELSSSFWQEIQQNSSQPLEQPITDGASDFSSSIAVPHPVETVAVQDSQALSYQRSAITNYPVDNGYEVGEPTNFEPPTLSTATESIIERFALQVMVYSDWMLIVDEKHVQNDPRQAQLWQQLQLHLKSSIYYFRFPLLEEQDSISSTALILMQNRQMALAGFAGFLYRVAQTHRLQTYRIGSVSKLSDCLDSHPIERLPYLDEMIHDYRLKRQLWQILSQQ